MYSRSTGAKVQFSSFESGSKSGSRGAFNIGRVAKSAVWAQKEDSTPVRGFTGSNYIATNEVTEDRTHRSAKARRISAFVFNS